MGFSRTVNNPLVKAQCCVVKKSLCVFGQPIPYCILFQFEKIFAFIGKMVKFWLKRDFTNCAYMSQSLYFIAKVASGVSLVVGLLFFPLFSSRPKKIALDVEVYGQVNS